MRWATRARSLRIQDRAYLPSPGNSQGVLEGADSLDGFADRRMRARSGAAAVVFVRDHAWVRASGAAAARRYLANPAQAPARTNRDEPDVGDLWFHRGQRCDADCVGPP